MSQRILGQNVSVIVIQDSAPLQEINCIRSFSFNYELELKDEGYLGETTNRKDSVFKGIKFDMELHSASNDIFNFAPTNPDGSVAGNNGISYTFNAPDVNPIFWMAHLPVRATTQRKQLYVNLI